MSDTYGLLFAGLGDRLDRLASRLETRMNKLEASVNVALECIAHMQGGVSHLLLSSGMVTGRLDIVREGMVRIEADMATALEGIGTLAGPPADPAEPVYGQDDTPLSRLIQSLEARIHALEGRG